MQRALTERDYNYFGVDVDDDAFESGLGFGVTVGGSLGFVYIVKL